MVKLIKKCIYCGKKYQTYFKNQKYCSYDCFKKYRKNEKNFLKRCQYCGKEMRVWKCMLKSKKFCSKKCHSLNKRIKRKKFKCKICGKIFEDYFHLKRKYCSHSCSSKYVAILNKRNGKGFCYDKKLQSKAGRIGGKIASMINRKNKTSAFFDRKIASKGGKSTYRKHPNHHKKIMAIMKKKKLGFFNSKLQAELGSKGGAKTCKILRTKRNIVWRSNYFGSYREMEFAMSISHQLGIKIIEGKSFQFRIGNKTVDFFINETFIEVHPWARKMPIKEYYKKRRNLLNENGYKNYPLILIK